LKHLRAADNGQALVHVPMAVVWEVSVLVRSARVRLGPSTRELFEQLFQNPAYQPYGVTLEQIFTAGELGFTRDPFDALIVAAAQSLHLPLLTRAGAIHDSAIVDVIW